MASPRHGRGGIALISSLHFAQHVFRILPPLLPLLVVEFPYPLWKLGALVSVYFAGSGLGQTPMGILIDRYDRRYVLPPSVGLMGAGYLVFALAPGVVGAGDASVVLAGEPFAVQFLLMGLGVFVAGVGASVIHPAGLALASANAPAGRAGHVFGAWSAGSKLGDAAAPTAVALLVLVTGWNEIFLLFGLVGVAYAVGLFYALSDDRVETRPAARRPTDAGATDADGAGSRADGTAVDAAETATDPDGTAVESDGTTGAGGIEGAGRPDDRRRYVYPMYLLVVFYVARAFSEKGVKAFLPTFLTAVYAYSFTVGGVFVPPESFANFYFTAVFLIAAAASVGTGWLVDRTAYDHRTVLIAFFAVATVAVAVLATGSLSPLALLAVLLVLGGSNWGWMPARDALVNDILPPEREGRTFGYLYTISHVASAVAPVVIGAIAEWSSLRQSFLFVAGTMLVMMAAIAALFSPRLYRPADREEPSPPAVE